MSLNVRLLAPAFLAGALALGDAGPVWAAPPGGSSPFVTALSNASPGTPGSVFSSRILTRLERQDQQLQQQSARIQARLTTLNNAIANSNNPGRISALTRLQNNLTRQEAHLTQRIQSIQQQIQRVAGTPSAPGGF